MLAFVDINIEGIYQLIIILFMVTKTKTKKTVAKKVPAKKKVTKVAAKAAKVVKKAPTKAKKVVKKVNKAAAKTAKAVKKVPTKAKKVVKKKISKVSAIKTHAQTSHAKSSGKPKPKGFLCCILKKIKSIFSA